MLKTKSYWPNNTVYFLTGSTFLHFPYFQDFPQKSILLNQFRKVRDTLRVPISSYSIAINHYHIKFYLENGLCLPKIKQMIHGGTSFQYKKNFSMKYQEMWGASHILQVTSEEMDWKITGYIIGNLLKHKEVTTFEELEKNPFSSYKYFAKTYGQDFARDLIYNVIDVNEDAEGRADLKSLAKIYLNPRLKPGRK
jgi:hypothetical protein